ncbi:2OG-Fe(II) oxygenase [Sphingobacterium lactis]|uniref:2OG-Fe(II) oxygenase n=1 Tax=Sphingobacterium lactis TaxID=797291 RepID=UPI003EC4CE8C
MKAIADRIKEINWDNFTEQMHANGYAVLPKLITPTECEVLKETYADPNNFRKTVVMERYRFGLGAYKYFRYPLPQIIQDLRKEIYPALAGIANEWFQQLGLKTVFPSAHEELLAQCHQAGQEQATVLILRYGEGGFNTLHQDLYGEIFFPMQLVVMLSELEEDYSGGEFVLTQQIPRAQSKAIVLQPSKGDVLVFTTNFKPQKGARGFYRVNMKHGVSEVHSGERYTLGVIFHDAIS